ncbi:MAG TPA: Spy/CpxP family protein refolding chaperone, partial [Longimicrobium sp.]|nr:Spy/CpxP family protein refolding chaperone [Longimicrobium sp.]
FTLTFPEGGGRYTVRATALGHASQTATLVRQADEDVLTVDFQLGTQAIVLPEVRATANRTPPPGRGDVGGQERTIPSELVNRLPLEDTDPARVAQLSPGVVGTAAPDSSEQRQSFSVAGQRQSLNQVTVDGTSFASALSGGQFGGGSPLGLPQEGLRNTQVITASYDVARGQFTGGLVSMTTRSGSNFLSGSVSWNLRDPTLQGGAGRPAWGGGFTQNRVSGGVGGPIRKDRAFWFVSASAQQRTDRLFSLTPSDGTALNALGVHPDSVQRFLQIMEGRYGVTGRTGRFDRTGTAMSVLGRVDVNLNQQHTLAVRGHLNVYAQDRARIGFLETEENGGEVESDGRGAIVSLNSRFGGSWINDARASFTDDRRDQAPYVAVPEGRVRVTSVLEDGRLGVASLVFGGDRSLPSASRETTLELADELSFLFRDRHRIKLGALVNHTRFEQQQTFNRLGSFDFNSLADFEAGVASRFTRSLAPRTTSGSGVNGALYLGDTWRPAQELQISFGLRGEASRFGGQPAANPQIEELFRRRTDHIPAEVHLSPRLGFSLRMNEPGAPLRLLRGGFGEFRGRAPFSLYASALDQTGLDTSEGQIICVGPGVPTPNWLAYELDEGAIPTTCSAAAPPQSLERRPTVTVFSPGFQAPRSWRASLGYQAQLWRFLSASIDLSQAWGTSLFGVRDLNLHPAQTRLPFEEGRPVYAPADAIIPATGEATFFASRLHPQYGQVFEVYSQLGSTTTLVTVGVNGLIRPRILFSASYTWMRSRDQSSFAGGSPVFGFGQVPVGGDPNGREWSRSDLERRHQVLATVGLPFTQTFELTLIGRVTSGTPYTPMVGGDINGDGARNDRAFVFDPSDVYDDALSVGMRRLLINAEGRVRDCLMRQFGRIAERNSCTGSWSTSLDARATIRPPQVKDRRLSISVDATNLPAGLDLLLHGQGGLHGWGQGDFGRDNILLYPKGWNPDSLIFTYQVNETFGQNRIRRATFSPFQVALTARVNVGRQQQQQQGLGGLGAIAFTGAGGGGGGGGRGGQGGGGFMRPGGGIDADLLVERLIPEPVSAILLLKDTLRLTDAQAARLHAISDSLRTRNAPLREQIRAAVPQGGNAGDAGAVFQRIAPQIQAAAANVNRALQEVQRALTPEQWQRVPAALRNPFGAFGPGGGNIRGGGRTGGQRPRGGEPSSALTRPQPAPAPPSAPAPARP